MNVFRKKSGVLVQSDRLCCADGILDLGCDVVRQISKLYCAMAYLAAVEGMLRKAVDIVLRDVLVVCEDPGEECFPDHLSSVKV